MLESQFSLIENDINYYLLIGFLSIFAGWGIWGFLKTRKKVQWFVEIHGKAFDTEEFPFWFPDGEIFAVQEGETQRLPDRFILPFDGTKTLSSTRH